MKKAITVLSMVFMLLSSCSIGQNQNDIEIDEFKKKNVYDKLMYNYELKKKQKYYFSEIHEEKYYYSEIHEKKYYNTKNS